MKRISIKAIHFLLVFISLTHLSFASTEGFKTLFENYQYTVTVDWDQQDEVYLHQAENEFKQGVVKLLNEGASTEELIEESLKLIPDQKLRKELFEYQSGKMSLDDLLQVISKNSSAMSMHGTSWSPALKVMVGVVGGYLIFKLLLITIENWDTDPNYGQSGQY